MQTELTCTCYFLSLCPIRNQYAVEVLIFGNLALPCYQRRTGFLWTCTAVYEFADLNGWNLIQLMRLFMHPWKLHCETIWYSNWTQRDKNWNVYDSQTWEKKKKLTNQVHTPNCQHKPKIENHENELKPYSTDNKNVYSSSNKKQCTKHSTQQWFQNDSG